MTDLFLFVLFGLVLKDNDLFAFSVFEHFGSYFCTCQGGSAHFEAIISGNCQNRFKSDFCAFFNVQFLNENEQPVIRTAETYILLGDITDEELDRIKHYCINPVDSRETGMEKPETLQMEYPEAEDVRVMTGMTQMNEDELMNLYDSLGLAMTPNDFRFIQEYFAGTEHRDPTITEIRVLDTYWSDHCRHTTFSTELRDVEFEDGYYRDIIEPTYLSYLDTREEFYKDREDKYVCLMDLAIMGMKKLKADGKLTDQEETMPALL